jgi:N-methylhydantoinase B
MRIFLYRDVLEGEELSNIWQVIPSKVDCVKVNAGDVLHYITWGGGGWGNPLDREPATVLKDVQKGLVSPTGAERFGVVIKGDTDSPAFLQIDEHGTTALRAEMAPAQENSLFNFGFRKDIKATQQELEALLNGW